MIKASSKRYYLIFWLVQI